MCRPQREFPPETRGRQPGVETRRTRTTATNLDPASVTPQVDSRRNRQPISGQQLYAVSRVGARPTSSSVGKGRSKVDLITLMPCGGGGATESRWEALHFAGELYKPRVSDEGRQRLDGLLPEARRGRNQRGRRRRSGVTKHLKGSKRDLRARSRVIPAAVSPKRKRWPRTEL